MTEFAARIRERYPEGLTGIIVAGGTRMTYALEHRGENESPGRIDMKSYGRDVQNRMQALLRDYFELGGQNIIMPLLSYQLFDEERGPEYAETTARMALGLMDEAWVAFYEENGIDPYFAGIDTLLHFPERKSAYSLARAYEQFQSEWLYRSERRKLIWEIAPIPLYSVGMLGSVTQPSLADQLASANSLSQLHDRLYRHYARALYGVEIPEPHFYIANNRNGDLKLRAMLPIALSCGSEMRLFFTPYPTLMLTRKTLQTVLEDLAFGKRVSSKQLDYSGQVTTAFLDQEYERALQLAADPESVVGLLRNGTGNQAAGS